METHPCVRTGPRRAAVRRAASHFGDAFARSIVEDETRFEEAVRRARDAGLTLEDLDRHALLRALDAGEINIELTKNMYVAQMVDTWRIIFDAFRQREWSVLQAQRSGLLITSDDPVSIYRSPEDQPTGGDLQGPDCRPWHRDSDASRPAGGDHLRPELRPRVRQGRRTRCRKREHRNCPSELADNIRGHENTQVGRPGDGRTSRSRGAACGSQRSSRARRLDRRRVLVSPSRRNRRRPRRSTSPGRWRDLELATADSGPG